jgi:NAD(P)-dependent dehydrogenase (short-subunit alcohol dehydrogenase family)
MRPPPDRGGRFARHLGGAIVTIGSVSSVVAAGRTSAYDASKGGVLQLTRVVAAFLASDDASFMTGAAVAVDGGYTAI